MAASNGKTILLVDDDVEVTGALERHLKRAGFAVEKACSASEAMALLKMTAVDAVVSDNHMTGESGTTFLANLGVEYPQVARFMLSGNVSNSQAWLLKSEVGLSGLFQKPCNPKELVTAIQEVLGAAKIGR